MGGAPAPCLRRPLLLCARVSERGDRMSARTVPDALRKEAQRRGRPTRLYRLRRYSPTTGEIVGTRFYAQSPAASVGLPGDSFPVEGRSWWPLLVPPCAQGPSADG